MNKNRDHRPAYVNHDRVPARCMLLLLIRVLKWLWSQDAYGLDDNVKKKLAEKKKKAAALAMAMADGEVDEKTQAAMDRKAAVYVLSHTQLPSHSPTSPPFLSLVFSLPPSLPSPPVPPL